MKKLIFLLFILFVGCSSSKSVVKDSTYTKTTENRIIDTTLKIINPITPLIAYGDYTDSIKIEFEHFTFKSSIDFESGLRKYKFEPKKDSIEVKVKVNEKKVIEKKTESKTVEKESSNNFLLYFGIILTIILGILIFLKYGK